MDDATGARRDLAPSLAARLVHLNRMEETRVRPETSRDHRSDVLPERVQPRADPGCRGNVAQPPEFCSPSGRHTSALSEHHHARPALAPENPHPQSPSSRIAEGAG